MIRKIKKYGYFTTFMIFLCVFSFNISNLYSQKIYGNEWIDFSGRQYYKIRIAKDGFYRIDYNSLSANNLAGNNPDHAHLWFRGKQVPILISHNGDAKFDAGEYIEFYGQRNDGTLDSVLYVNPSHQPHRDVSLYKDTSVYFLTWSATETPARIKEHPANTSTSISPATFFREEKALYFSEEYYSDLPFISAQDYFSAEYREGEGYNSKKILKGQSREVILEAPALVTNGEKPEIEFLIYGRSDYDDGLTTNPNDPNDKNDHKLLVQIRSGSGTYKTLLEETYNRYKRIYRKITLDYADIGPQTYVKVSSLGANNAAADVHSIAYIKLRYPRQFTYSGYNGPFKFNYQNPNADSLNHFNFSGLPSFQNLFLYDLNNGIKSKSFLNGSDQHFTLPNSGATSYYLFSEDEISVANIDESVTFSPIDYNAGYNYLIVTNKKLLNAANEFKDYKQGTKIDTVNNFKPLVVTIDQLVDQFFYGVYHPAAIQRFCAYMYNNATEKPQYLFLAGKGYDAPTLKAKKDYSKDLVPIIGLPSSDMLYTAGIDVHFTGFDNTMDPNMAVGRISAKTEDEFRTYLDKLKNYENSPKDPWHKHVMHISAGDPSNQGIIRNYMDKVSNIISSPYVGATLWRYNNTENTSVNTSVKERIQGEINAGTSMLTFFGHGSPSTLGVDIGYPDELLVDVSSTGKFPFFYVNGCKSGVIEAEAATAGETWIFAKNKGAIAWMGHSSTGYTPSIGWQLQQFYNNLSGTYYGASIGELWRQTIKDLDKNPSLKNEDLYRNTSFTLNLQGDPSVRLPLLPKPDYALFDTAVSIFPEDAISTSDSVSLRINAYNLGKVILDSFEVKVQRVFPNGQTYTYDVKKYPPLYNRSTIDFWMPSLAAFRGQGLNKVTITIDPQNKFIEEDELNNTINFTFNLTGNGARQLFPVEFSISPVDTPQLIVQSRNLFDNKTGTYFEIDTNLTFSSPWVKRSPLISGNNIMKWRPNLMTKDSVVYYWRVRLDVDTGQAGEWETRSFTYIKNSSEGWSQSHFQQFSTITSEDLIIDTTNRVFNFKSFFGYVTLVTHSFWTAGIGIITETEGPVTPRICPPSTLLYIEFDKNSLKPVGLYPTCFNANNNKWDHVNNFVYYRQFDMRNATSIAQPDGTITYGRDSFVHFINKMQDGNYVALITKPGARIQQFYNYDEATFQAFEKIGATKVRDAAKIPRDSLTYALLGRKGAVKGQAVQENLDFYYLLPTNYPKRPDTIIITGFKREMSGVESAGSFTSRIIGPAKKWKSFHFEYNNSESPSSDEYYFTIDGIDKKNQTTTLEDQVNLSGFNLSDIDAKEYPYLQITAHLRDTLNRTPAKLKIWQVLYEGVPEGTLLIDNEYAFKSDTLPQGDSIQIAVKYRNVSKIAMDSVAVRVSVEDAANKSVYVSNKFYQPLAPDSQFTIRHTIPTSQLKSGLHRLSVFVNPDFQQPELTLDNNLLRLPVYITGDIVNPIMDVTFDGRHIMDGELVSAKPTILITNKDENRNRVLNDTSLFKVMLRRQGATTVDTIRFSSNELTFRPGTEANNKASVEFRPQNLEDGVHELIVQAYDATGNRAGEDDYKITFEVINKSMVSNFFVYPNPFSTKSRFVFTLTGSEVPAYMKVQIMTITGKVVKEIGKEDLGDIHIGHNISNYSWDGTDEYGDLLANGLYMYRVIVKNDKGKQLEAYKTSADKFFENNFGKLYILR